MTKHDGRLPTQEEWMRIARALMELPEVRRVGLSHDEFDESAKPVFLRFDEFGIDLCLIPQDEDDARAAEEEAARRQRRRSNRLARSRADNRS